MLQKIRKQAEGFTIIEVLIVLAIAGLILLIVFLAVPALQRNQRNTARNSEAARISAAVTECLANRNGTTTTCGQTNVTDVSYGTTQQLTAVNTGVGNGTINSANVYFNYKCQPNGAAATNAGASARDFVVMYQVEPAIQRCIGSQ